MRLSGPAFGKFLRLQFGSLFQPHTNAETNNKYLQQNQPHDKPGDDRCVIATQREKTSLTVEAYQMIDTPEYQS
jgi:hypothetical protein